MTWQELAADGFTQVFRSDDGRWQIEPAINTEGGRPAGEELRWALSDRSTPHGDWIAVGTIDEMKTRAELEAR